VAAQQRSSVGVLLAVLLGVAAAFASGGPATPETPLKRSVPVRLTIESIGVDAPVAELGLNPDGTLEDPPLDDPNLVGWYALGASPGEAGPAVLTGHLDTRSGPSVFARLNELRPDDLVHVARADGSQPVFVVDRVEQVPKEDFPTDQVYGPSDRPELRLVTCAGDFDPASGHYSDSLVVYAVLAESGG
jgi:sortase (surface protein transpeptidase)